MIIFSHCQDQHQTSDKKTKILNPLIYCWFLLEYEGRLWTAYHHYHNETANYVCEEKRYTQFQLEQCLLKVIGGYDIMMKDVAQTTSLFTFVTNIVLQLYLLKLTLTSLLVNAQQQQQQQAVCHNNKRLSGLKYVYKDFNEIRTCCNGAKHSCTKQVKLFCFVFLLTNQLWPFRVDILVLHTPPLTNKKNHPLKEQKKKAANSASLCCCCCFTKHWLTFPNHRGGLSVCVLLSGVVWDYVCVCVIRTNVSR